MATILSNSLNVEALLDKGAYPHPVGRLEQVETHISWVILTGELAYKIKKPVNFGFLDYSTLERRRRFCHDEVRLNLRWAPSLYLGVAAITGSASGPQVDGQGPALEYAVKMRQFPQRSLYDRQLREGRLSAPQVEKLARWVARCHATAPAAPADSPWGTPASVVDPARDNFRDLARLAPTLRGSWEKLRQWMEEKFATLSPLLEARKLRGRIRELHGDLHLGNVAEVAGQPCPFDGIEFNEAFRWIDTVNDLAFLLSDLEHLGRPDLASRALDAYLEQSGDIEGVRLLDFYWIYRQMVRAKIAAIRASQGLAEQLHQVAAYARQALERTAPRQARLLLTHGPSGSGKSYLSQRLVEVGWMRLRSDALRKRLAGLSPWQDSQSPVASGIYTPAHNLQTYQALANEALTLLECGQSVVVDATFLRRRDRDLFRALAEAVGVPYQVVSLDAPRQVLEQRLQARGRDCSEADLDVLDLQLETQEPLGEDEPALRLGATLPPVAELLALLC